MTAFCSLLFSQKTLQHEMYDTYDDKNLNMTKSNLNIIYTIFPSLIYNLILSGIAIVEDKDQSCIMLQGDLMMK